MSKKIGYMFLLSFVCISFYLSYITVTNDGTISKEPAPSIRLVPKSILAPIPPQGHNYSVQHLAGCETIHVLFVIQSVRSVVAVLRSIFLYRHSPLHFHFISDLPDQTILEKLLITWELPSVNYSFYPISEVKKNVSWINSTEQYSLMKLVLPSLLPSTVDRVIVLDSNIMILSDIQGLWTYFDDIRNEGKLFAVAKDLSFSQVDSLQMFNTDVMLFDLQAMRNGHIWSGLVQELVSISSIHTCHTIINSIIENYGNYYTLPCSWNVLIRSFVYIQKCEADISEYHLVQWNSYKKTNSNRYDLHFQNINSILMQYDGDALQDIPITCDKVTKNVQPKVLSFASDKTNLCKLIKEQTKQVFRTHIFFYGKKYTTVDEYDTTLVTQLSLDRQYLLKKLLKHWNGPISITMYGSDYQAWDLIQYVQNDEIGSRTNVAIHLVYKRDYLYPVNYLRNIALNAVSTPYVFLCDGDFLPNYNLYSLLKKAAKTLMNVPQKRALVVPAFEKLYPNMNFPSNKLSLLQQLEKKLIRSFHPLWKHGHFATNYELWEKTSDPYTVKWELYYEPYVMVKSNVVRYDQRFVGYGFNKASQIMELNAQGYEFVVLPNAFVIHIPHPPSTSRTNVELLRCVRRMFGDFIQSLIMRYGEQFLKFDTSDYSSKDQLVLGINRLFSMTKVRRPPDIGRNIDDPLKRNNGNKRKVIPKELTNDIMKDVDAANRKRRAIKKKRTVYNERKNTLIR